MKTITMNLDEYYKDLASARASGISKRKDVIKLLHKLVRCTEDFTSREFHHECRRDIFNLINDIESENKPS